MRQAGGPRELQEKRRGAPGWAMPHGPSPTHHLLAGQGCVPVQEERARLLVQGDEHGPVGGPGFGPAHEADHALVAQAGLGRTGGAVLVHQL